MTGGVSLEFDKQAGRETFFRRALQVTVFIQTGGMFFSIALSSIAFGGAILAFLGLILTARDKKQVVVPSGLEWYFVAYILAVAVMVLFAEYPASALHSSRRILLISLVYFIPASLRNIEDIVRFFVGLAIVVIAQSGMEFGFYLAGKLDRINLFQHYMTAGGMKMVVLMALIPMLFVKEVRGWRKGIIATSIAIAIVTLVLTQTRSSWLGFSAGVVVLATMQFRKIFIAIPVAVVLFLLLAPSAVKQRVTDMLTLDQSEAATNATVASNVNRIRMWKTGWKIFTEYPITGVGDGEVWHIYRRYVTPDDPAEGGHFHNTYIHILATHGILGFLAVMAMFLAIVYKEFTLWRSAHTPFVKALSIGMLAAFVGFAVNGMAEYNFGDHEILVLLWLTVGIVSACHRMEPSLETANS